MGGLKRKEKTKEPSLVLRDIFLQTHRTNIIYFIMLKAREQEQSKLRQTERTYLKGRYFYIYY